IGVVAMVPAIGLAGNAAFAARLGDDAIEGIADASKHADELTAAPTPTTAMDNAGPASAATAIPRVGQTTKNVTEVPIDQLTPLHPVPRPDVKEGHIDDLAASIGSSGYDINQAIPVVRMPDGHMVTFGGHH